MIWLESLLDTLSTTGISYSDEALSRLERNNWLEIEKNHTELGFFKPASIGRKASLQQNIEIRNDEISWLDEKHPQDTQILSALNQWRIFLNKSLFLSMCTTEAHFARYSPGHFYKRHKDQHDSKTSRVLTFVVYLHSRWNPGDGGELVITDGDSNQVRQIIKPLPGRVVIFKSDEIWHEVRKSSFERISLTGWFRYDSISTI